jgi:SagB-type dehydrogenase family enzyme
VSSGLVLSWQEGVTAAADGNGTLVVQGPQDRVTLRRVNPLFRDALRRFDPPGEDEERLAEFVGGAGNGSLARWYYTLERLNRRGMVCQSAHANGKRLATLVTASSSFVTSLAQAVADRGYVLSRFAYFHRSGGEAVLESPLTHGRVRLNDCLTAAILCALTAPVTAEQAAAQIGALPGDAMLRVFTLLLRAGMLEEADNPLPEIPSLETWEFHDLLFHARTRSGRSNASYGGTYHRAGRLAPPPALKSPGEGPTHELYRPDLDRLERDDPPLAWVMERRISVREFDGERPISKRQLGEFLFRVARVRVRRQEEVATPFGLISMDFATRPYPAGGSLYELEFYLAVNLCAGLDPGLYYYDPDEHQLREICGRSADVESLLQDAARSTGVLKADLQVLLILATRLGRLAWKYESIAYALTVKHVGVAFQTMYLAATAMGLGPCAVGGGDSGQFARATGTDFFDETSVGEFLLGSRQHGSMAHGH